MKSEPTVVEPPGDKIVIISGIIMMIVGATISSHWTILFMNSIFQRTVNLNNVILKPKASFDLLAYLNSTVFPVTSVVLFSSANDSRSELLSLDPVISERIFDPMQKVIVLGTFTGDTFSQFKPITAGTYKLSISNLDTQSARISGLFGYLQFINNEGQLSWEEFEEIFAARL